MPVSSSHTIHYRPGSEFDSPAPGPGQFGNYPNQVATANNGDTVSHHSSYRNTPVPQVSTHQGNPRIDMNYCRSSRLKRRQISMV